MGQTVTCPNCQQPVPITDELFRNLSRPKPSKPVMQRIAGSLANRLRRIVRSATDDAVRQPPQDAGAPADDEVLDREEVAIATDAQATMPAPSTVGAEEQSIVDHRAVEAAVDLDWTVGDVILDLYDVLPVDEEGCEFHEGGYGKVYKVHHRTWDIDLAVKCPHAHLFVDHVHKENFTRECQAWIDLGLHPQIASCYYVRELGGVPRIFAEYVDGGSLQEAIECGSLYEGQDSKEVLGRILDIAIQFAWGLHYAHERGLART